MTQSLSERLDEVEKRTDEIERTITALLVGVHDDTLHKGPMPPEFWAWLKKHKEDAPCHSD